jgi:hypothetical protein
VDSKGPLTRESYKKNSVVQELLNSYLLCANTALVAAVPYHLVEQ